jgi:hypothetical protein
VTDQAKEYLARFEKNLDLIQKTDG